jgi:hypothetical protein
MLAEAEPVREEEVSGAGQQGHRPGAMVEAVSVTFFVNFEMEMSYSDRSSGVDKILYASCTSRNFSRVSGVCPTISGWYFKTGGGERQGVGSRERREGGRESDQHRDGQPSSQPESHRSALPILYTNLR